MRRHARAALRLTAVTAWTSATVLRVALLRLLHRTEAERAAARTWARGMCRLLGVHVRVEGVPPSGRYLLVCNHLSYVDVVVLMSALDATLLSKAEVGAWPVIGALARFGGTLFVDRTRRTDLPRVLGEIERVLAGGHGVVFFPEGTSSAGYEVLPFKASLFEVAARGGIDLACAALHYATAPGDPPACWSVCWWGDMGFGSHLWPLLGLERVDATLRFGAARVHGDDRKQLSDAARAEVLRLFEPVCAAADVRAEARA